MRLSPAVSPCERDTPASPYLMMVVAGREYETVGARGGDRELIRRSVSSRRFDLKREKWASESIGKFARNDAAS